MRCAWLTVSPLSSAVCAVNAVRWVSVRCPAPTSNGGFRGSTMVRSALLIPHTPTPVRRGHLFPSSRWPCPVPVPVPVVADLWRALCDACAQLRTCWRGSPRPSFCLPVAYGFGRKRPRWRRRQTRRQHSTLTRRAPERYRTAYRVPHGRMLVTRSLSFVAIRLLFPADPLSRCPAVPLSCHC
jgi:hypothetical protein